MANALLASVRDRVSLVRALLETKAITPARLEEELALTGPPGTPFQGEPIPILELVGRLPPHLCESLVAVPVHAGEQNGTIDIALADASDAHAAEEIGFFLETPVRVVRAPLGAIESAIKQARRESSGPPPVADSPPISAPHPGPMRPIAHTPMWGSPPDPEPHEEPIPLSRRVTPGAGLAALARAAKELEDEDEPVVELRRAKPPSKPPVILEAEAHTREQPLARTVPDAHNAATSPSTPLHHVLREMTKVTARDPLMELVLIAVRPLAPKSALFAVKKDSFTGLMCTSDFGDREGLAAVRIDAKQPSFLSTTATVGTYVGPMPKGAAHTPLAPFIKASKPKILAVSIKAAGRPAVLLVAHDVADPLRAMTVFSEVARGAGEALERILRAKH
jgi:hypothetical protein